MACEVPHYESELRRRPGDTLIVCLSHKHNYSFYKRPFPHSTLFIVDERYSFYALYSGSMADHILQIAEEGGFTRLLFFGLSKGGYGALLLSALTAQRRPDQHVRALAFSPASYIYPLNPAKLPIPTYRSLMARAEANPTTRRNLERYGDLRRYLDVPNLSWLIVHGDQNPVDVVEAGRLAGPHIDKYTVPFGFHGSTMPFTLNRADRKELDREVCSLFRQAETDPDLRATLPGDPDALKRQLLAEDWIPSLEEMLERALAMQPAPGARPAGQDVRPAARRLAGRGIRTARRLRHRVAAQISRAEGSRA